jgi:hypothetical protein
MLRPRKVVCKTGCSCALMALFGHPTCAVKPTLAFCTRLDGVHASFEQDQKRGTLQLTSARSGAAPVADVAVNFNEVGTGDRHTFAVAVFTRLPPIIFHYQAPLVRGQLVQLTAQHAIPPAGQRKAAARAVDW